MLSEEQIRQAIVDEARAELAATGGKAGPECVEGYRREVGLGPTDGKHWCGIMALAMLRRVMTWITRKWRLGGGFCEEAKLDKVRTPKPGDIAVFQKNWHHCIVTAVDEKASTFDSIDGNQGSHPPRKGEKTILEHKGRPLRSVYAFYSIKDWIDAQPADVEEVADTKGPDTGPPEPEPTLRVGDSGEWVGYLQKCLFERGARGIRQVRGVDDTVSNVLVDIVPDGKFGPVTESAVARFQAGHQLAVDGVCGPATWHALLRE
jgi:hypothetical protein